MTGEAERARITVGTAGSENEAERQQLTTDLIEHIVSSGTLSSAALRRESENPGETMAGGSILSIDLAGKTLHALLQAVRSWLASRRTEIQVEVRGRKVKISAANFEEAMAILDTVSGM
jgi:hypothetical protein